MSVVPHKQNNTPFLLWNTLKPVSYTHLDVYKRQDDESGNIYKQLVVGDETGAIIVGVNNSGLYAFCPVGQKVVIRCV